LEEREGGERTGVETRERRWRRQRIREHQGEEKQRRRRNGIPQGLIRDFRKLQGLVYKAKFSHCFKTRTKKCPKRKLESFSNSTTLL
jgi:hypothetical protein